MINIAKALLLAGVPFGVIWALIHFSVSFGGAMLGLLYLLLTTGIWIQLEEQ